MLDKIKALCKQRNISIVEMEQAVCLGAHTVYRWGSSFPSVDKVKAVADFFGITVDELLQPTDGRAICD